jgi:hypothetical protein
MHALKFVTKNIPYLDAKLNMLETGNCKPGTTQLTDEAPAKWKEHNKTIRIPWCALADYEIQRREKPAEKSEHNLWWNSRLTRAAMDCCADAASPTVQRLRWCKDGCRDSDWEEARPRRIWIAAAGFRKRLKPHPTAQPQCTNEGPSSRSKALDLWQEQTLQSFAHELAVFAQNPLSPSPEYGSSTSQQRATSPPCHPRNNVQTRRNGCRSSLFSSYTRSARFAQPSWRAKRFRSLPYSAQLVEGCTPISMHVSWACAPSCVSLTFAKPAP